MQDIIKYIKQNVLGRPMFTDELMYRLEEDTLEGVYSDQIIFSGIQESAFGFCFDMHILAKETVYTLDENQNRLDVRQNFDSASVFRYDLAQRKGSGDVTGVFRLLLTTGRDQTAQATACGVYDMDLTDGVLSWKEVQLLYRDQPAADGGYRSVAFDASVRFFNEEGKLRFEYVPACYDVDPVTMERKPSKDAYPVFLTKEL